MSSDTFDEDSPDHRFDLGHLLPSRVPDLDLFESPRPNSRVPSSERNPTPEASTRRRPATSPSHDTSRQGDGRLEAYLKSRFSVQHGRQRSDASLSSDTESTERPDQDPTRDSPLSRRKDILTALFDSSPSSEESRGKDDTAEGFRRHKPRGGNQTVTQQDFWGTATDFLSQARGKMMDSKYAVQATEPTQSSGPATNHLGSSGGRAAGLATAASNPLLQSKYAVTPRSEGQENEKNDNDHASGYRFTEVTDTMEEHVRQLEQPEEGRGAESEQAIENKNGIESLYGVQDTPSTLDSGKDISSPVKEEPPLDHELVAGSPNIEATGSVVNDASTNEYASASEESKQRPAPQEAKIVSEPVTVPEEEDPSIDQASTAAHIAPILPAPSPRPSIKVPWGKKTVTIRIPQDALRGKEGGPPVPLHPEEVAARIASFEEQGYDTRGFLSDENDEEYGSHVGSKQNRPIFPDLEAIVSDAQEVGRNVRIPDPKAWQAYVDFLTEQKLRALGVSLGDEEPPAPAPGLSRQSSTSQYPPLPFSPPVPPSSGGSQQISQAPNAFQTASMPEPLSASMSRKGSIASPLPGFTPNNPRALLQRQGSFPFSVHPQQSNVLPFPTFSPKQQFASPLTGPRAGSPATQHPFANRSNNVGSPGPTLFDMQQLSRYPPAMQAELIAQMQRQQQQQLQARLQQQQQLALNTKLPDLADDDLEEEQALTQLPIHTGMVDRDQQEIAVPRPRTHRHNLSVTLEKDIPNAEYHLGKQMERETNHGPAFNTHDPFAGRGPPRPELSRQASESRWNEAVQSIQVLNQPRQTRSIPDNAEQRMVNAENRIVANPFSQGLGDDLKSNPSEINTTTESNHKGSSSADEREHDASLVSNGDVDEVDSLTGASQAQPTSVKHGPKPSISGLNVEAKEFKFNPDATFQPGNFSFSGANFQLPQSAKQPQPNYSRPLPQPQQEKSPFNFSASAFNPKGSFGSGPSTQGFSFNAPSFKPGAPEFKPLVPPNESISSGEQPLANRIFTSVPTARSTDIVQQPRKSKAIQIINPNLLPKPVKPEVKEDELGRPVREDDRPKRARRADDDGDQIPQFAFPTHADADFDATAAQSVRVAPSNDQDERFEEIPLDEQRVLTPPAAAILKEKPISPSSNTVPTIDELRQKALNSMHRPSENATTAEDPSPMSPAQAALHAILDGKRHGHKSSLSATAKPFEFKPLSSDNDFPSFSGKTSEIIDSQNDSSQILSSPTQPLESSVATTFRPSDSSEQTASEPRKQLQLKPAPYPTAQSEVNYDDLEEPSLAEIDDVMKQLNENNELGVEKEGLPSWDLRSGLNSPFQAEKPLLEPWNKMRSDAPSPSPNRIRPTIEPETLEEENETVSHDPFSDSHAAVVDVSPVRRLNHERDVPISDWDDAFSSSEEEKLKAQVQSRSIFFEPHVEKVVAKALQSKMDPMMTTLMQLQDSMSALNTRNAVERRSVSPSPVADSDADDEDDDEEQRPPRSRSRGKAFPTPELLNPEKIKSIMIEALQVYNTPPTPPAPGVTEFHEALVSLKAAVARSDAEKMQLEDIRAIVEETLDRRDSALVPISRSHVPYPEDEGQIVQLDKMLQDATVRAAEAVNQRNEVEDRAAETRKLLRLAEEEVGLYKELDSDKEHSLRSVRDELSDLKEHLRDVQEHRVAAEKERQSLTTKLSSLEEEHAAMESTLEEYRESKQVWRQEIDDLTKEREVLKSNVTALMTQVKDGRERREDMRDKFSYLQGDMARSAEQMASAKAHWHQQDLAHQTRNELLSVRIGDEARTRERLEKEIERLETQEKEHMKLRVLVDHTQTENVRLEDIVTTVKKELYDQQQLAARFEREFNDARDTARAEVQRTRTLMEADVEAANQQVNLVRANLEAENARIRVELEAENARLRTELDNSKLDTDTAKEKHALLLEEAADAKRDALQEVQESRSKAINELHQTYERRIAELQANHSRAIGDANEVKERSETLLNERLSLSDAKVEHYQDRVVHLEQKLEVAQSAAQAAVKAAQSAKAAPQVSRAANKAGTLAAAIPTSTAPVPEKISPQALRESIIVLQEQLQERESRIERLESELKATDSEAPAKLRERDTEISWLRELLGVRVDDLSDLVNALGQPAYDPDTVRDAAIRIRTNLQMEQQEKERLIAAKVARGQNLPVTVAGQQALASISNFASPKAAQLAAAFGNWRKGNQQLPNSGLGRSTPLRPSSNASTQGWMTGLMTPPTSNLRKTPSPSERTASPEKPRTPQRQTAGGASFSSRHGSLSPQTSRRHNLTARQLAKLPIYNEDVSPAHAVTPPLLRKASYDTDAEPGEYGTAGFEGFEDEDEVGVDGTMDMSERISPEPPRLRLDFGAPIGEDEGGAEVGNY